MNQKRAKTQKLSYHFRSIALICLGLAEHLDVDYNQREKIRRINVPLSPIILQAAIRPLFQRTNLSNYLSWALSSAYLYQNSRSIHFPLRVLELLLQSVLVFFFEPWDKSEIACKMDAAAAIFSSLKTHLYGVTSITPCVYRLSFFSALSCNFTVRNAAEILSSTISFSAVRSELYSTDSRRRSYVIINMASTAEMGLMEDIPLKLEDGNSDVVRRNAYATNFQLTIKWNAIWSRVSVTSIFSKCFWQL
jgi:hypothetical protein